MTNSYISQLPILIDEKIILPKTIEQNLEKAVMAIIEQTDTPEYRQWMKEFFSHPSSPLPENIKSITTDFVQDIKSPFPKNFASFDFHLDGETPKCIEFSFFPAGDSFIRGLIPSQWNTQYQHNFEILLNQKGKIAITDCKIQSQKRKAEFEWITEEMKKKGKEIILVESESIYIQGKSIIGTNTNTQKKETIDFILNQLTFSDYLANPAAFSALKEIEQQMPEKLSTTYREWLFSEKISSSYLCTQKATKSTHPYTLFSLDPLLDTKKEKLGKKHIAKPLFSYASKGIIINPSTEQREEILQKKLPYLFQEIVPTPTLDDGRKYEIRVFMVNGKISTYAARVYSSALSNYDDPKSGICQVEFQ